MADLDPLIELRAPEGIPDEKLIALLLAMLDRHSELQERLGMIGMDERIEGGRKRRTLAGELANSPREQLKLAVEPTLDDIATLEHELEWRITVAKIV